MEGLNHWTGMGNLGAEPELRISAGGSAVLKLRLACSDSFLNRDNVRQERTEWVSVTVFGKRAEALVKILKKGDRVGVAGRLSTSSYEKDGEKRYRTEIIAEKVILNGRAHARDSEPEERTGSRPARSLAPPRTPSSGGASAGPGSFDADADDALDSFGGGDFAGDIDETPFIHQRGLGRGRP